MIKSLCVLIPSYNEARTIGDIVSVLRAKAYTVYVVDDGSTDDTAGIARSAGAIVIRHDNNMGKGASLREGFAQVVDRGFDAVIVMDGDGQHQVSDIEKFIAMMDSTGADIIIGNRMMDVSPMPLDRKYTNRFMSWLISLISGQHIPDSQSGYRLIRGEVLKRLNFESSNFEIESEMIIRAARAGFRIKSVPIKTVYEDEKSKMNPVVDTFRFVIFLIKTMRTK